MSRARILNVFAFAAILLSCIPPLSVARAAQAPQDNDQTLRAMRDENALGIAHSRHTAGAALLR